jgi:hypothetical protein
MISTYAGTETSSMEAEPGEAPSETEPTDGQSETADVDSFMYSTGRTTDGTLVAEETGETPSRPGAGLFKLLMTIPTRYWQLSATMGDIDSVDWFAFVNEVEQIARDYRSNEFTCIVTRSQFLGAPMRVSLNGISVGRAGSERSLVSVAFNLFEAKGNNKTSLSNESHKHLHTAIDGRVMKNACKGERVTIDRILRKTWFGIAQRFMDLERDEGWYVMQVPLLIARSYTFYGLYSPAEVFASGPVPE